jgi:uncharacterized membrane protein YkvA (DUF1232 family)
MPRLAARHASNSGEAAPIAVVARRSDCIARLNRMAFERSKEIARSFKRELIVYQRVLRDERTPSSAKLFLALAVGYFCMPFDLIPDFIPVIGHLDDAIIVPALVFAALRLVPREIVSEHRERVVREQAATNRA